MDPEIGAVVGVEEDINSLISKTEELKSEELANFLTSQLDKGGQREELYSLTPQIGRLSQRVWNSTPDSLKSIGWLKKSSGGNSLVSAETRTVFGSKATIIGPHPHTEDTAMHYLFDGYRFTVSFDKSGNFVVPGIDPERDSELFTLIKGETLREYMNALISHNKVNKEYMGRLVASFPELNETWIKAITNINTEETTIDLPEKLTDSKPDERNLPEAQAKDIVPSGTFDDFGAMIREEIESEDLAFFQRRVEIEQNVLEKPESQEYLEYVDAFKRNLWRDLPHRFRNAKWMEEGKVYSSQNYTAEVMRTRGADLSYLFSKDPVTGEIAFVRVDGAFGSDPRTILKSDGSIEVEGVNREQFPLAFVNEEAAAIDAYYTMLEDQGLHKKFDSTERTFRKLREQYGDAVEKFHELYLAYQSPDSKPQAGNESMNQGRNETEGVEIVKHDNDVEKFSLLDNEFAFSEDDRPRQDRLEVLYSRITTSNAERKIEIVEEMIQKGMYEREDFYSQLKLIDMGLRLLGTSYKGDQAAGRVLLDGLISYHSYAEKITPLSSKIAFQYATEYDNGEERISSVIPDMSRHLSQLPKTQEYLKYGNYVVDAIKACEPLQYDYNPNHLIVEIGDSPENGSEGYREAVDFYQGVCDQILQVKTSKKPAYDTAVLLTMIISQPDNAISTRLLQEKFTAEYSIQDVLHAPNEDEARRMADELCKATPKGDYLWKSLTDLLLGNNLNAVRKVYEQVVESPLPVSQDSPVKKLESLSDYKKSHPEFNSEEFEESENSEEIAFNKAFVEKYNKMFESLSPEDREFLFEELQEVTSGLWEALPQELKTAEAWKKDEDQAFSFSADSLYKLYEPFSSFTTLNDPNLFGTKMLALVNHKTQDSLFAALDTQGHIKIAGIAEDSLGLRFLKYSLMGFYTDALRNQGRLQGVLRLSDLKKREERVTDFIYTAFEHSEAIKKSSEPNEEDKDQQIDIQNKNLITELLGITPDSKITPSSSFLKIQGEYLRRYQNRIWKLIPQALRISDWLPDERHLTSQILFSTFDEKKLRLPIKFSKPQEQNMGIQFVVNQQNDENQAAIISGFIKTNGEIEYEDDGNQKSALEVFGLQLLKKDITDSYIKLLRDKRRIRDSKELRKEVREGTALYLEMLAELNRTGAESSTSENSSPIVEVPEDQIAQFLREQIGTTSQETANTHQSPEDNAVSFEKYKQGVAGISPEELLPLLDEESLSKQRRLWINIPPQYRNSKWIKDGESLHSNQFEQGTTEDAKVAGIMMIDFMRNQDDPNKIRFIMHHNEDFRLSGVINSDSSIFIDGVEDSSPVFRELNGAVVESYFTMLTEQKKAFYTPSLAKFIHNSKQRLKKAYEDNRAGKTAHALDAQEESPSVDVHPTAPEESQTSMISNEQVKEFKIRKRVVRGEAGKALDQFLDQLQF